MAPKKNPLNLNALQAKTLVLLQALSRLDGYSRPAGEGEGVDILRLPHAHGDHFHLGAHVVGAADCTGLNNPAVWRILERKSLVAASSGAICRLTPAGIAYETGFESAVLKTPHHS